MGGQISREHRELPLVYALRQSKSSEKHSIEVDEDDENNVARSHSRLASATISPELILQTALQTMSIDEVEDTRFAVWKDGKCVELDAHQAQCVTLGELESSKQVGFCSQGLVKVCRTVGYLQKAIRLQL